MEGVQSPDRGGGVGAPSENFAGGGGFAVVLHYASDCNIAFSVNKWSSRLL